jgi:hypothetical protein
MDNSLQRSHTQFISARTVVVSYTLRRVDERTGIG